MKTLTKTLAILLMMLLAVSCSKEEGLLSAGDELSDVLKTAIAIESPVHLSGYSSFFCYAPKTKKVHSEGSIPCDATMELVEGQWHLKVVETLPAAYNPLGIDLYRHIDFLIKITPSGSIKTAWPETWFDFGKDPETDPEDSDVLGTILLHTGCALKGSGVADGTFNYFGSFDGCNLQLSSTFIGKQIQEPAPGYENYAGIEGTAHFEFSFDLDVVGCPTP